MLLLRPSQKSRRLKKKRLTRKEPILFAGAQLDTQQFDGWEIYKVVDLIAAELYDTQLDRRPIDRPLHLFSRSKNPWARTLS